MKSTTLLISTLLASAAIAQPHGHFAQHHHKEKRSEVIEWVTEWVTDIETVGYTATVWVSAGFVPPAAETPESSTTTSTTSSSVNVPAQFFQGASTSSTSTTTSASSTSVYVAPVPTTPTSTSEATSTTPVYVAPVVEPASSITTPVAAVETVAPVVVAATSAAPVVEVPTTSAAAEVAATTSAASTGASTGECSESSPCAGDMTHYDAGLGACGWTNNGTTESVVALAHEYMGTQSNGNPFCGRHMTIKCTNTGKTTTALVVDKCMGCTGYSIDLSDAAYSVLDSEGVGREGATWWWND